MTSDLTTDTPLAVRDKVKRALRNAARLEAVERTELAAMEQNVPALDRVVRVAARAVRAPVAQLNVLTDLIIAPVGVHVEAGEDAARWRERRPVGNSICKYVVWQQAPLVVDDVSEHRLVAHGNATRDLSIAAYIGVPIHGPAPASAPRDVRGPIIGTLCAVDHVAREWTAHEVETMIDCAAGISELIAHRIHTRDELRAAERQTARLLTAAAAAVIGTDAAGVTTFANPAAEELLGYGHGGLEGHDIHALVHHSYADGSRYFEVDCPNFRARNEGRTYRIDGDTFWRADGTPIAVDVTMTPIFDRGEVIGTVMTFQGIGDRARLANEERASREAAEAANHAKSVLLTSIAHELRIPLTTIGDTAERLEAAMIDSVTAEQRAGMQVIRRSQQFLLELTENVLEFAALDATAANSRR